MPTNYKLTTDLIADCMGLIPQNLGQINKSLDNASYGWYCDKDIFLAIVNKKALPSFQKFLAISQCLRTIPEFQAENPLYKFKIKTPKTKTI